MGFLQCNVRYGAINVLKVFDNDESLEIPGTLKTGDITIPAPPLPEVPWAIEAGVSLGTTLDGPFIATDDTITVFSVVNMSVEMQIGIRLDTGVVFWTRIIGITSLNVDLAIGLPSAAASGNQVITTGQIEGETDFIIEKNYKERKVKTILFDTEVLQSLPVAYNDRFFHSTYNFLTALSAFKASSVMANTITISDYDGADYTFMNIGDLNSLIDVVAQRLANLLDLIDGESELLRAVIEAENTQADMDAIVDSRT